MSGVAGWAASALGVAGSAAAAVTESPVLLVLVLALLTLFATLRPLITFLALAAVYDPNPDRRAAAAKILDGLLVSLRADRRPGR
ncbi:MAG TPA: hypothetical protein VFQ77_04910 [Pseudonocardiaceae bacterium]|nr:hypothetical protein [Pseudonocardiaceae bacterium]